MKKIGALAVASTAMISTAALAGPTDQKSYTITATVLPECSLGNLANVTFSSVNINEDPGSGALLIQGTDTKTQRAFASCNTASRINVSTGGGLKNPSGAAAAANDPNDFTNEIEYRIRFRPTDNEFDDVNVSTVSGPSAQRTSAGAFHTNAFLDTEIRSQDNAKRPVAGTYSDTATITLTAI